MLLQSLRFILGGGDYNSKDLTLSLLSSLLFSLFSLFSLFTLSALVRFFACEQDLSHGPPDAPLPDAVAIGAAPFLIVGAMAGG